MNKPLFTRRRLLQGALATGIAGVGSWVYARRIEPHWLEIVEHALPMDNLPERLAGATLVHLSDLHIGKRVSDDFLQGVFKQVQDLAPDLVVYTGDFTSYHADIFTQAQRVFAHLPTGKRGTFGILGNHDYGPAWSQPAVADELAALAQQAGVTILRNEVQEVDGLQMAGLDDLWAAQFRPERPLRALDQNRASIVLSHNPDTVDKAGWGDYRGWVLAGHTHGGQCKPPFLPPPLLPVRNRRYTAGAFDLGTDRNMYISRGIGHLLRARFNVRPEVTIHRLEPA